MKRAIIVGTAIIVITSVVFNIVFLGTSLFESGNVNTTSIPETKTIYVPKPSAEEMLRLVNEERAKVGVKPLVIDERLNKSAQYKAEDMLKNNYFGHVDNQGRHGYEYIADFGKKCKFPGENITENTTTNTSKQAIVSWKNSPPHYKAMIDPRYESTGFGIAGTKIVQHFCDEN